MNRQHPGQPVEPATEYFVTTSGTRGRYYTAQDGTHWFCEEDGTVFTWKQVLATHEERTSRCPGCAEIVRTGTLDLDNGLCEDCCEIRSRQ